jgi:hypothetical protein
MEEALWRAQVKELQEGGLEQQKQVKEALCLSPGNS